MCNRSLGKRMRLLKHLDKCIQNQVEDLPSKPIIKTLSCSYCDYKSNSSQDLEKHLWDHVYT